MKIQNAWDTGISSRNYMIGLICNILGRDILICSDLVSHPPSAHFHRACSENHQSTVKAIPQFQVEAF